MKPTQPTGTSNETLFEPPAGSQGLRHPYLGDPCRCRLEQNGFGYLDRHDAGDDDIASVVIPG